MLYKTNLKFSEEFKNSATFIRKIHSKDATDSPQNIFIEEKIHIAIKTEK